MFVDVASLWHLLSFFMNDPLASGSPTARREANLKSSIFNHSPYNEQSAVSSG
jgi:hypothetical protein